MHDPTNPTKIFAALDAAAKQRPDATAVVHQDRSLSYQELFAAASRFATHLTEAGLTSTDLVGLVCGKDIEFVIAFLAFLRRGNPVVPLSPALRPAEILEMSERLSLTALCYSEKFSEVLKTNCAGIASSSRLPTSPGMTDIELVKLRDRQSVEPRQAALAQLGISSIRLSSGTTGQAKGIMISEDAIWWRAECNRAMHDVRSDDCLIYLVSMDLASPHLIAYFASSATVIVEEAHNFDAIRRLSTQYAITHVHATPVFYQMMLNQAEFAPAHLCKMKYFISTGAPLPSAVAEGFRDKFGFEISQYYGLGECGPVFVNVSNHASKRGAAGVLLPEWEINFAEGNSDSPDLGELLVRGPGLFDGYYEPWRLADDLLVDGWFRTGDLVRRDNDGYYWIVGRTKDLINVGGTKVFPWEIEDLLMSHPGIEEALVYGEVDARFGEVPHAKVKPRAGAAISERELLRYVNARLAILKNLRKVEFVSALPRTKTGKVKRWD